MKIALFVEGQSDEKTLPILLRKSRGESMSVETRWVRRGNLLNPRKVAAVIDALLVVHADVSKIIACVDLECTRDAGTEKSERARIRRVERAVRRLMGKSVRCTLDYIPSDLCNRGVAPGRS